MNSLVLTVLLSWGAPAAAVPQNDTGDVAGVVTRLGGEPLADVTVTVWTTSPIPTEVLTLTTTGPDGRFRVPDMPVGAYRVSAESEGYVSPPGGFETTARSLFSEAVTGQESNPSFTSPTVSARVDVRPGAVSSVDLVLMATGVVTGRVTDSNGRPLALARVEALELMDYSGRPLLVPARFSAKTTDDRGVYRLFGLVPGDYYVRVEPEAPGAASAYFPGVSEVGAAAPVIVRGGSERGAADIRVPEPASVRVSGRALVEGVEMESREVSEVYLVRVDPDSPVAPPEVYPNVAADRSDGEFLIEGVPPGLYDLFPLLENDDPNEGGDEPPGLGDFASFLRDGPPAPATGSVRVLVGDADVDGVVSVVRAPLEVTGRFIGDLEGPRRFVRVILVPVSPLPFGPWPPRSDRHDAERAPDGRFRLPGVPRGQYRVVASGLPAEMYVDGVSQGGMPAAGRLVTLDGPTATDSITVDVRAGAGVVSGVVDGFSIGATVLLVPAQARPGESRRYRRVDTDESGGYTFRNVAPGEYALLAFERLVAGAGFGRAFLDRYAGFGVDLFVTSGAQRAPDLQVVSVDR